MQDPVFMAKNEIKDLTDECGKIDSISEHATMMVPFYYIPLLVVILLPAMKLIVKAFRSAPIQLINYDKMFSYLCSLLLCSCS